MFVYTNLLFSIIFVQAGGPDNITEIRQAIYSILFIFVKGSGIGIES